MQQLCSHTNHQSKDKKPSSPVTSNDIILPQFEVSHRKSEVTRGGGLFLLHRGGRGEVGDVRFNVLLEQK